MQVSSFASWPLSPRGKTEILIDLGAGWVCRPAGTLSRRDRYLAIGVIRTPILQSSSRWPIHDANWAALIYQFQQYRSCLSRTFLLIGLQVFLKFFVSRRRMWHVSGKCVTYRHYRYLKKFPNWITVPTTIPFWHRMILTLSRSTLISSVIDIHVKVWRLWLLCCTDDMQITLMFDAGSVLLRGDTQQHFRQYWWSDIKWETLCVSWTFLCVVCSVAVTGMHHLHCAALTLTMFVYNRIRYAFHCVLYAGMWIIGSI